MINNIELTLNKIFFIVCFTLIIFSLNVNSQTYKISGKVIDNNTHEPLAFVNVVYGEKNLGTSTNIDGNFTFQTSKNDVNLVFSYLGYSTKYLKINATNQTEILKIELIPSSLNLNEITIVAGKNPAHRIINAVVENREKNNPESLNSFSYISYNKMYFTVDPKMHEASYDSIKITPRTLPKFLKYKAKTDSLQADTNKTKSIEAFFSKNHIFMTETVSERKFLYPDKNQEKVIASRSSGLKQPYFLLLATQLQSFSFYTDIVEVGSKKYLSPVAKNATKKYFFQLEDTIFTENRDSVFVISYRPLKNSLFDGLKGVLQINSNGYALQSVIAEPLQNTDGLGIKIQQKYEFIKNNHWFPVQLNTDLKFSGLQVSDHPDTLLLNDSLAVIRNINLPLLGVGKSYIDMIEINPYLTSKQFNSIQLEITKDAAKKDSSFWNIYRSELLSKKEIETYKIIDSLGEAEHLDAKLKTLERLTKGYIQWGFINFNLAKMLSYNHYEGLRPCLDIITNEKIVKWISIGGYGAYGTKDKDFKYGGRIKIGNTLQNETQFVTSFSHDVSEVGTMSMIDYNTITSTEIYRQILVNKMYNYDEFKTSFTFRWLQYFKTECFGRIVYNNLPNNYSFNNFSDTIKNVFITNEVGTKFKFSYKEKFMKTFFGKYSLGSKYPTLFFNVTKGIKQINGNFDYLKFESKINANFDFKLLGKANIQLSAGLINKTLPLNLLYTGYSNYSEFSIDASNTFATMRMNEFYSDKFASLFFTYDFGKLLFKAGKFQPGISICQNIGFGNMQNKETNLGFNFNTMEKGYYETGIIFSNIIHQSIAGYGLAVYYRYGSYGFTNTRNNFAIKLSFKIN